MKLYIYILIIFQACFAVGQRIVTINLPAYDKKAIHFGFSLGLNILDFRLKHNLNPISGDTIYSVETQKQPGFTLGIVSNFRLGEYWDFRFIPSLAFGSRALEYRLKGYDNMVLKNIESTFLEFPCDLKFKSDRLKNGRAYLLSGINTTVDMVSQAKIEDQGDEVVKLKRFDFYYAVGVGFDFYFEYFKFSPQLKVSYGIRDMLVQDYTIYSDALNSLKTTCVLISFTFE